MKKLLLILNCAFVLVSFNACSKKCSCTITENGKERTEELDLSNTEYKKCQDLNTQYPYKGGTASINCDKSK